MSAVPTGRLDGWYLARNVAAVVLVAPAAALLCWMLAAAVWVDWFAWASPHTSSATCTGAVPDEVWGEAQAAITAAGGGIGGFLAPAYAAFGWMMMMTSGLLVLVATFLAPPYHALPGEVAPASPRTSVGEWAVVAGLALLGLTLVVGVVSWPWLTWFSTVTE